MTRLCSWGKRQKKSSSNSLGSEKPPFPSPQSTLGPPIFFYAVSLRFLHFPFTSEPGLSLLWTGLTAVHIRAQNSMKKNGETYQSRICFTEVKFLVDSCDLPTLIGNILGKKISTYIRLMHAVLWLRGSEENDVPLNNATLTDIIHVREKTFTFNLLRKNLCSSSNPL